MFTHHLSAPMDRRSFLSTGCKAAVGVAALALVNKNAFAATDFVPLLSIGFAPALPASGGSVRLADAGTLYLPDPAFLSHGARVFVAGSARGAKHRGEIGGVAVDAVMPILGRTAERYPRYRFWSAAGDGALDSVSGNLSFTMHVEATNGITLVARRLKQTTKKEALSSTAPADVDATPFTLSLGSAAGPKLQRGVYVVALRESPSETFSDWSRFSLVANEHGVSVAGADFDWVILKVDYAQ
jgi:hypothetical protein